MFCIVCDEGGRSVPSGPWGVTARVLNDFLFYVGFETSPRIEHSFSQYAPHGRGNLAPMLRVHGHSLETD